ncbi:MAG: SBBP repeat-containing protein [Bacteroidota bacterium]
MNWSSFLHSGVSDDYIMAVMRDASDFVYTVGYTKAMTFPLTPGVYQNIYGGGIDAFVTKLDPSGTSLIYSTFIGGTSWEMPYGMDLVNDSEVILAGFALSSDYPTSATAYQTTNAGGLIDGFISRLSANGDSLVFSTYFGGSDRDYLYDMQADASGNVYVTGYTLSTDMPTSPTAYSTGAGGAGDIFVAKFSPDGSSLQYATFLGGNSYDIGNAIRVNANGEAFVAGTSGSANFPTTANAYQSNLINGGSVNEDGVFAKVSADGSSLVYSSYIGGNSSDGIYGLDLEGNDVVYLTGTTYSTNFPTSSAAYQFGNAPALGNGDAFVTKFDVSGNSLVYSTYVGGSDLDFPKSLRVNNNGEAVILGATRSANWPISPTSAGFSALYDLFVIQLSDDGSALLQSDLYGGSYNDYPRTAGSLFLSGNELTLGTTVHSPNMPSAGSGYQATKTNGVADAPWMVGLHINTVLPAQDLSWSAHWQTRNQWVQLAWEDQAPQAGTTYEIEVQRPGEDWTQLHSRLSLTQDPLFTLNDPDAALWRDTYVSYRIRLTRPNGEVQLTDLQEVRIPRFGGISLQAFPIPAQDWMTVRVQAESPQPVYLRLVDLKGRTVWKQTYAIPADEVFLVEEKISLEEMSAGLYLLHAQVNGASQIQKILIQ